MDGQMDKRRGGLVVKQEFQVLIPITNNPTNIFFLVNARVCVCVCVLVTLPCPPLGDPTDYCPAGSSIHGIFWARTPETVAVSFSTG